MDIEHHNKDGDWIADIPRNQFERDYKAHITALEAHLCDQGKVIFRDLIRLVDAELDRLHTAPSDLLQAPQSDDLTPCPAEIPPATGQKKFDAIPNK